MKLHHKVRRPCSDFAMLRRLVNCRIITIITGHFIKPPRLWTVNVRSIYDRNLEHDCWGS